MRSALYLRRSTNEELQADSLNVQREILTAYAAKQGYTIVREYADSASGTRAEGRPQFLQLIADVRKGCDFESILVRDVSRWGRFENTDEGAYYEFVCIARDVQVIYVEEAFEGDHSPYAALMKSMKRVIAAEFSRERSRSVRYSQSRVVAQGFMHGGPAPYGLKRVLVDMSGKPIQDLARGDHKLLGNSRVMLAPGSRHEVHVVRRMFHEYASEKKSVKAIADGLNSDGIRGGHGGAWTPAAVGYVLRNPRYVGRIEYRKFRDCSRSERLNVRDEETLLASREGSFLGIISRELWDAVQKRLKSRTWRKSNVDLARDLREAFEKWGQIDLEMLSVLDDHAHFTTYANRFRRGYTEALELAYESTVTEATARFRNRLENRFAITDLADGWLIDDLLFVRFKYSWPRARHGGLRWEFEFVGDETEDITIGFAFSPPPSVCHVETFLFQTAKFRVRQQTLMPSIRPTAQTSRYVKVGSDEDLWRNIEYAIYWRNKRAERRFLDAIQKLPLVNLATLARTLKWRFNAVLVMYARLEKRGVPLPPRYRKRGRRITVQCSRCGAIRTLLPSDALQRKTDLCVECIHGREVHKVVVTCPDCGKARNLFPSQAKQMKYGCCRPCAQSRGRDTRFRKVR